LAGEIEIDPITLLIVLVVIAVGIYAVLWIWGKLNPKSNLLEKRGLMKSMFDFNRLPTVPTIRIVSKGGLVCLELGKRARLRENSLKDNIDDKGWDIESTPIPIIEGKQIELGYLTHPAGCTLDLKPFVKIQRADDDGNPVYTLVPSVDENGKEILNAEGKPVLIKKPEYIEASFEGVIGVHSDLDDFNESTEREISKAWMLPLLVGIIVGWYSSHH
jgi:hypothetical protein